MFEIGVPKGHCMLAVRGAEWSASNEKRDQGVSPLVPLYFDASSMLATPVLSA